MGCIGVEVGNVIYLESMMGIPASLIMTLTLEEGGVLSGVSPMSGSTEPTSGTWTGSPDALTLSFDDERQASVVNGQLRFISNGMGLAFAKQ